MRDGINSNLTRIIFGKAGKVYVPLLNIISKSLAPSSYRFVPLTDFESLLLSKNIREGMKIYWGEILYRAHLAAVVSLLRHQRWVGGMVKATEGENFLVFATALRGFIESVADAYDALDPVPMTFADHFSEIKSAVKGKADVMYTSEELERRLIHFSHAKKLPKVSSLPDYHRAKTTKEYLAQMEDAFAKLENAGGDTLHDCYSELCNIVHPADLSVSCFLDFGLHEEKFIFTLNQKDLEAFILSRAHFSVKLDPHWFIPPVFDFEWFYYFEREDFFTVHLIQCNVVYRYLVP